MNVVLIGAGNLATNLAFGLQHTPYNVTQVYSRTLLSAKKLAEAIEADATSELSQVQRDADLYVISIKDDALEEVIARLCEGRSDKMFVHTAGSMPMDVFRGHCSHYGVFYPMQTFSKTHVLDFKGIPCFVEGNGQTETDMLLELGRVVSGDVSVLDSERRKYLHLAAVFACNFANHCFALGEEILQRHQISPKVLLPLIKRTVDKLDMMPARVGQTGPAVRYDRNVIDKQVSLLDDKPLDKQIYEMISESIHEMALQDESNENK